jgi:hypothetical protein
LVSKQANVGRLDLGTNGGLKTQKREFCMVLKWNVETRGTEVNNWRVTLKKMAVFWVVRPCGLVKVYRRFRTACRTHHQGDEPASTSETSANLYHAVQGLRFSRQRYWSWLCSGLLRRVVWWKFTDVSEVLTAFFIRALQSLRQPSSSKSVCLLVVVVFL